MEHCEYCSAFPDVVDQHQIPHGFDLVVEHPHLYYWPTKLDMASEENMSAGDEVVGGESNHVEKFPKVAMGYHNALHH